MIELQQLLIRLLVAMALGALLGLERELVGKSAGIRTSLMVSAGAAMFTMAGLSLPYMIGLSDQQISDMLTRNGGYLSLVGNVVVGIGFLGAGIIIQTEERVRGLTTAAVIWATAAIGILCGIGLLEFAALATFLLFSVLFILRHTELTTAQK